MLQTGGVAASGSELIEHDGQRFLQVERFDRIGARGRRALNSLEALDAEFVGRGQDWPQTVRALAAQGTVVPEAVPTTELLWAFGTLIANTDMHSGNLAFVSEQGRPYRLAPAYDMTPMAFAPTACGEVLSRPLALRVGDQVPAQAWRAALPLAQTWLARLQRASALSDDFSGCTEQLRAHLDSAAQAIERLG